MKNENNGCIGQSSLFRCTEIVRVSLGTPISSHSATCRIRTLTWNLRNTSVNHGCTNVTAQGPVV